MTLQTKNLSNSYQTLHCAVKKHMFPHLQSQTFNQVRLILILCVNRLKSTAQTTDHVIESDLRRLMIPEFHTPRNIC